MLDSHPNYQLAPQISRIQEPQTRGSFKQLFAFINTQKKLIALKFRVYLSSKKSKQKKQSLSNSNSHELLITLREC